MSLAGLNLALVFSGQRGGGCREISATVGGGCREISAAVGSVSAYVERLEYREVPLPISPS